MTPFNVAIVRWVRGAFRFGGRSSRSEYWWPRLLVFGVNAVCVATILNSLDPAQLQTLVEALQSDPTEPLKLDVGYADLSSPARFAFVFAIVFSVLTFIPNLAVSWRRFHDLGRPGWFHLLFLFLGGSMPLIALAEYVWLAFPGTDGTNRFGADPRQVR